MGSKALAALLGSRYSKPTNLCDLLVDASRISSELWEKENFSNCLFKNSFSKINVEIISCWSSWSDDLLKISSIFSSREVFLETTFKKFFNKISFLDWRDLKDFSKTISEKTSPKEKIEEISKRSSPQDDQHEIISTLISENEFLKSQFEKFYFSQNSLDILLTSTRRSHKLAGLGYLGPNNAAKAFNPIHLHKYFVKSKIHAACPSQTARSLSK